MKMNFKKIILPFYLIAVLSGISCEAGESKKKFDEFEIAIDEFNMKTKRPPEKKIMNGDEIKFRAVSYDEKLEDVNFTVFEKSTNKKICIIPAEDIITYEYDGEYTTYYESKWTVTDCRAYEDTSKLWYYVEVSAKDTMPMKSKPVRIWNPHIIDFKLINDTIKGENHMEHVGGIYYRTYVRIYFKGCDLYGFSDYFCVDYVERDETTDETDFFTYWVENDKKNNTFLSKKFRLVAINPEIDWVEKCKQTLDIKIYPQVYFANEKVYKFDESIPLFKNREFSKRERNKEISLLKEYDDNLSTHVEIGGFEIDIPYWVFKDLNAFSQLLKNIEKQDLSGYSHIIFNGGDFILQM